MIKKHFALVLLVLFFSPSVYGAEISGLLMPEYYMVTNHHTGEEGLEGQHGSWIRRIYFGYKTDLVYTLMYGNYGSNKGEDNKGKGFYARLGWESENGYLEANGHFANDNGKDNTYFALFGGLKGGWGRFGISYFFKSEKPGGDDGKHNGIISGYAVIKVAKKTEIFARCDYLTHLNFKEIGDYVPVPAKSYKARFLMAGLNFKVHKTIRVSPNIKYVFYGGDNAPDGDLYLNLTANITFKTKIGSGK